jgi:hypothetical protein
MPGSPWETWEYCGILKSQGRGKDEGHTQGGEMAARSIGCRARSPVADRSAGARTAQFASYPSSARASARTVPCGSAAPAGAASAEPGTFECSAPGAFLHAASAAGTPIPAAADPSGPSPEFSGGSATRVSRASLPGTGNAAARLSWLSGSQLRSSGTPCQLARPASQRAGPGAGKDAPQRSEL